MSKKYIIISVLISIIIGCVLGATAELALIYEIDWLINITQSLLFWGVITVLIAIFSKGYILSMVNPILSLLSMNATYYLIRLGMSGYTNMGAWLYWFNFMAIFAGLYIGSVISYFKEFIKPKNKRNKIPKYNSIFMTIGAVSAELLFPYLIRITLFNSQIMYWIMFFMLVGMIIGTIIGYVRNKKVKVIEENK